MRKFQSRTWLLTGAGVIALAVSAAVATAQDTTTRARSTTRIRVAKDAARGTSSNATRSSDTTRNYVSSGEVTSSPTTSTTPTTATSPTTSTSPTTANTLTTSPASPTTSPATSPTTSPTSPATSSAPPTGNALTGSTSAASTSPSDSLGAGMEMSAALTPNDVAVLDAMTDPNILAHIAASDSSEVAISQPFVTTAQGDAVRAFAQTLVTDHSKALEMARAAAQQANITPQASPADSMQLRMMSMMQSRIQSAPLGAERDRMFVNVQVMHHQHALSELQTLRNVASNAAVRAQIDSEIPVVQSHLEKARELLRTLGASSNGMNMNMGTSPPSPTTTPPTTTPPSNPPTTSNPPE